MYYYKSYYINIHNEWHTGYISGLECVCIYLAVQVLYISTIYCLHNTWYIFSITLPPLTTVYYPMYYNVLHVQYVSQSEVHVHCTTHYAKLVLCYHIQSKGNSYITIITVESSTIEFRWLSPYVCAWVWKQPVMQDIAR